MILPDTGHFQSARRLWRGVTAEIADVILAADCIGCGHPGTTLCRDCHRELLPRVAMTGATPSGRVVRAGLRFDGTAARVIRAVKGEGRTGLMPVLAPAMQRAVHSVAGVAGCRVDALVPVPTSREAFRRRGFGLPELLARRTGEEVLRALRPARAVVDQRGLGRTERRRNVAGSMRALLDGVGRRVIVVDDVLTTGATLDEASRVLEAARFRVVGCAVLAFTPSFREPPGEASETGARRRRSDGDIGR